MGLGYVTIGPKTYEIKRKRFTVWLGSGELVGVGGELALLLGRIFQGDYSRVWKGRKLRVFREALREGFVNCVEGKLSLTEKGKEVLREFLTAQEQEEYKFEKRRKKVAETRRTLLRLLKRKKLTVSDVNSGVKFDTPWVEVVLVGEGDFRVRLQAWIFSSFTLKNLLKPCLGSFVFSVDSVWFRVRHGELFRYTVSFLLSDAVIRTFSLVDERVKMFYEACQRDSETDI